MVPLLHRAARSGWWMIVLTCSMAHTATAMTLTVPDDVPSVAAALDSLLEIDADDDTVFVRSGLAPENIELNAPLSVSLIGLGGPGDLSVLGSVGIGGTGRYRLSRFRLAGRVDVWVQGDIQFSDCVLDFDLSVFLSQPAQSTEGVRAVRCSLQSVSSNRVSLSIDSCAVAGSISRSAGGGFLTVRNSVVQGGISTGQVGCSILHNRVGSGILLSSQTLYQEVIDNEVWEGIVVFGYAGATVQHNLVHGGHPGILVDTFGLTFVQDNTVLGAASTGLLLKLGRGGTVSNNVIRGSAQDGMDFRALGCCEVVDIHHNTSYDNGGSGFALSGPPTADDFVLIHHNIAYRNSGHGLTSTLEPPPSLSCNDWFANDSSGVAGVEPGASDLAVDPLFCDVDHDSVSLAADSPVLDAPGCGLIGARGVGCSGTATLVERFEAVRVAEGVRLTWRLARGLPARLERASDVEGPWDAIALESSSERDAIVALDRNAPADRTWWYRLAATIGGQDVAVAAPILVPASSVLGFELRSVAPNPGRGPFTLEFTLAREAHVELDVFDVQGRLVRRAVHGTLGAGTHRASWNAEGSVPSGIYMVRYRHPDGEETRAFVRAR